MAQDAVLKEYQHAFALVIKFEGIIKGLAWEILKRFTQKVEVGLQKKDATRKRIMVKSVQADFGQARESLRDAKVLIYDLRNVGEAPEFQVGLYNRSRRYCRSDFIDAFQMIVRIEKALLSLEQYCLKIDEASSKVGSFDERLKKIFRKVLDGIDYVAATVDNYLPHSPFTFSRAALRAARRRTSACNCIFCKYIIGGKIRCANP